MVVGSVVSSVGKKGFGVFKGIFKLRIFFIFLVFILLNAVVIGIQEKDIKVTLVELGNRFLTPTLQLQQTSLEIIERGGLYESTPNVIGGLWDAFIQILLILSQFYIILMWINVLAWLLIKFPIMDASKTTTAWIFGLIFFLGIQMLLISIWKRGDVLTPIHAFWDFIRASPYIIKKVSEIGDKFVSQNSSNISITN